MDFAGRLVHSPADIETGTRMSGDLTDSTSTTPDSTPRRRLAGLGALPVLAVPAIVAPAIVWARVAWHARHPGADATLYPTISRAISDPAIGEPFAFWVTLAALLLWPATHAILWMLVVERPDRAALGPTRDRLTRGLFVAMSLCMTATCVGMVWLARFRLGATAEEHRMHMIGSYVFFAGQATTIFLCAIHHALVGPARRAIGDGGFFTARARARGGFAVVAAAAFYGVVFHVKDGDFGPATGLVIAAYVELETVLIIVFLAYLACYFVDLRRFLARRLGGA